MGILDISHDLLSVVALCHRIAILNSSEIVECGPLPQIFGAPQHAYTQKLVAVLPRTTVFPLELPLPPAASPKAGVPVLRTPAGYRIEAPALPVPLECPSLGAGPPFPLVPESSIFGILSF